MCVGGVFEKTGRLGGETEEKVQMVQRQGREGFKISNHNKKEKERTCSQTSKVTRGHVLIINDPSKKGDTGLKCSPRF